MARASRQSCGAPGPSSQGSRPLSTTRARHRARCPSAAAAPGSGPDAAPQPTGVVLHCAVGDWPRCVVRYAPGPAGPWLDADCERAPPGQPHGWVATLPPPGGSAAEAGGGGGGGGEAAAATHFSLHSGAGRWLNAGGPGVNFAVRAAGSYAVPPPTQPSAAQQQRPRDDRAVLLRPLPRRFLLVSDLDGTLVGGDPSSARLFSRFWAGHGGARSAGAVLAFSTGRSLASYLALASQLGPALLPEPDVLICGVGTRVYVRAPGGGESGGYGGDDEAAARASGWRADPAWAAALATGGWGDGSAARAAVRAALAASPAAAAGAGDAHWRPDEEQSGHKLTFAAREAFAPALAAAAAAALAAAGVAAAVRVSGDSGWRYVDVLPAAAGKRPSLGHVAARLGFSGGPLDTVAAGDSGNDVDMLAGRCAAIVVGNAQPELAAWADRAEADGSGQPGRLYRAAAGQAAGVMEGLRALHFAGGW